MPDPVSRLAQALARARSAVALTGAGVSTASGIPDFRSRTGLWARFDPAVVATLDAWRRDPDAVWEFYRLRLAVLADARPNPAHAALAELERLGAIRALVTQNVDGLHRAAGSLDVVEVHGDLERARCLRCGAEVPRARLAAELARSEHAPRCSCGAPLKPGVVLFGEMLPADAVGRAFDLAAGCDLLLVCGTSLEVHPIAGMADAVLAAGGSLAILTEGPTPYDRLAAHRLREPLDRVLPELAAAVAALSDRGGDAEAAAG